MVGKYFVLDPEGNSRHARASRAAMSAYAEFISGESPNAAAEIMDWAEEEARAANKKTADEHNRKSDLRYRFELVDSYLNSSWFPHKSPLGVKRKDARKHLDFLRAWLLGDD